MAEYSALVRQLFVFGPPVVAALNGHAIAGGLIAVMGADERIAAEGKSKFGLSEVILGVSVPACLMEPFRHVVGPRHMERLAATGENVSVDRALAIGLVDRVVPVWEEDAFPLARQLAREEGLFVGMSSGAIAFVALAVARELGEGKRVAWISPDSGSRYLTTPLFAEAAVD